MSLLDKHGHDTEPVAIDRAKLMARLAVISKMLELEDFDDLSVQIDNLDYAKSLNEIAELILQLNKKNWTSALATVKVLLERGLAVTVYLDPRVQEFRWQVRVFGVQVMALEAELADMQRQIHLFDYQQEQSIGDLIRRYLDAKRRYLKNVHLKTGESETLQEAAAAEDTYQQYEEARAASADEPEPVQLDPQQQVELKQVYRKLAMQCHPDRVKDEAKARAQTLFQQVQAAYQNNDLARLQMLQQQIEQGLGLAEDRLPDQADHLQQRMVELQKIMVQLTRQIAAIGKSATWQTLSTQSDWSVWFAQRAGQLQTEIERYQSALDQSPAGTIA